MTTSSAHILQQWRAVPVRVAELLPRVLQAQAAHVKAALAVDLIGQTYATWQPDTDEITVYGADIPDTARQTKYAEKVAKPCTFVFARQPNWDREILIKNAGIPGIAPSFDYMQKAMGGATPLTNALLIGLTAGGVGYGTGALIENLFPERYIERGKLRRTLGGLGALGGLGYGAIGAHVNARANDKPWLQGWTIPNDTVSKHQFPKVKQGNWLDPNVHGNTGMFGPPIDVPELNEAIWRDTRKGFYNGFQQHTPPAYAATAAGFMSGLSAGTQSPVIHPVDVINGIASAGVGLATATVAGKALSALAGLTPLAQEKIQDMGLWGGMMKAIVPSILGLR